MRRLSAFLLCTVILGFMLAGPAGAQRARSESDFVYAKKLYEDGLYDLAAEAMENYVAAFPDSPHRVEASLLLGEALFADGKYEEAQEAFQLLHARYPDNKRGKEALFRVADCYAQLGDRDRQARALRRFTIFYPSAPETPAALLQAAQIYVEDERWADAETPIQLIINQYKDFPRLLDARLLWAEVLAGREEYDLAIAEARHISENAQDDDVVARALALKARWQNAINDTAGAEKTWREVLAKQPKSSYVGEALTFIAHRMLQSEQVRSADSLLQKALLTATDPAAKDAIHLSLGDARFMAGKYSDALKEYETVTDGESSAVLFRKGLALEMLQRDRDAVSMYMAVMNTDTAAFRDAALWREAALSGDPKLYLTAEETFADTLARAEALYLALYSYGGIDPTMSISLAESLLVRYPWSRRVDDAALLRAGALTVTGQLKLARAAYDQFAQVFPFSPYSPFASARSEYLTDHVIQTDEPHLALADLLARVPTKYDPCEFTLDLAQVYLEEFKRYDEAERELRKLLDDKECDKSIRDRATVMLARVIVSRWNKWKAVQLNVVTDQDTSQAVMEMASRIARQLEPVIKEMKADNGAKLQYEYELIQLRALTLPLDQRISYNRKAWSDYLDAHVQPWQASAVYLNLAKAYAVPADGDTVSTSDVAQLYIDTLLERWPYSKEADEALLLSAKLAREKGDATTSQEALRQVADRAEGPLKIEAMEKLIRNDGLTTEERIELMDQVRRIAWYHPLVEELDLLEAELLVQEGRYNASKWALEHSMSTFDPGNPGLIILGEESGTQDFWLAKSFEGQDAADKAEVYYRRYLTTNPDGDYVNEARLNLANIYMDRGKYDQAADLYRRMLGEETELNSRIIAHRRLTGIQFASGEYDLARETAQKAASIDIDTDSIFAYDQLSVVCLYRSGQSSRTEGEIARLERKYKDRPDWENAEARFWLERGRWYTRLKSWPEAQRAYERVIEKYARSTWTPYARYELGRDYLTRNLFEEGLDILTSMPDRYPEHPVMGQVYLTLGNYFIENGNMTDGITAYERVLADETSKSLWPTVLRNQIQAYKAAGFYAGALKVALAYLELYPNADDVFEMKMQLGQFYVGTEQYEAAVDLYKELIVYADVENEAACQFFIGEALEKQGRYAEAIIEYLKVKYLGKPTKLQWAITALYNAGRCYERLDQPERAMELYRQIVTREGLGSPFGRKAQEQVDRIAASLQERE